MKIREEEISQMKRQASARGNITHTRSQSVVETKGQIETENTQNQTKQVNEEIQKIKERALKEADQIKQNQIKQGNEEAQKIKERAIKEADQIKQNLIKQGNEEAKKIKDRALNEAEQIKKKFQKELDISMQNVIEKEKSVKTENLKSIENQIQTAKKELQKIKQEIEQIRKSSRMAAEQEAQGVRDRALKEAATEIEKLYTAQKPVYWKTLLLSISLGASISAFGTGNTTVIIEGYS